jgi:hypothetical protein
MRDLDDIRMAMLSDHDRKLLQQVRQQEEISHAGRELRKLRKTASMQAPRQYSGYLSAGRKSWVGQRVILPNNAIGEVITVHRGFAAVAWNDPLVVSSQRVVALEVKSIQPFRHPCAVALGRLKAGCREAPSSLKAAKARLNGRRPVKAGSRPRGRPRKPTEGKGSGGNSFAQRGPSPSV